MPTPTSTTPNPPLAELPLTVIRLASCRHHHNPPVQPTCMSTTRRYSCPISRTMKIMALRAPSHLLPPCVAAANEIPTRTPAIFWLLTCWITGVLFRYLMPQHSSLNDVVCRRRFPLTTTHRLWFLPSRPHVCTHAPRPWPIWCTSVHSLSTTSSPSTPLRRDLVDTSEKTHCSWEVHPPSEAHLLLSRLRPRPHERAVCTPSNSYRRL